MHFLSLQGVSKSFRTSTGTTEVLRELNLEVKEGEFVAILGYSGSGKTTLINLIAGLTRPDKGRVCLRGREVTEPGPDCGVVFQNYSLLPWMTVYENIALAVDQRFPDWTPAKRREQVEKQIELVSLTPARDKLPRQLSGGMRQRVALARGLAVDPAILLLDEPLGALDALTRGSLQEEIVRLWSLQKKTVLLITNDVDEALLTADRIIPLTLGPGATLAESIEVPLARPRDRKALNHDPAFKHLRAQVTRRLLSFKEGEKRQLTTKISLPDLLPEDLSHGRPWLAFGRQPRRRPKAESRETITLAS